MSRNRTSTDIPEKPAERRVWILYQLRLRGLSFRSLSRQIGCSPQAVFYAASGYPSMDIEVAIASAIGVPHAILFPEHFDEHGQRLRLVMSRKRKSNAHPAERNVETHDALCQAQPMPP